MRIGKAIHSLRKERRLTLAELSKRSGVALATLSRIENGKMTGTVKSHLAISRALEVPVTELYKSLPGQRRTPETRRIAQLDTVFVNDKNYTAEPLIAKVRGKRMLPLAIRLRPGATMPEEQTKRGIDKFICVLTGTVDIAIGTETYRLARGSTLYFDASVPHSFANAGIDNAELIAVSSPPA